MAAYDKALEAYGDAMRQIKETEGSLHDAMRHATKAIEQATEAERALGEKDWLKDLDPAGNYERNYMGNLQDHDYADADDMGYDYDPGFDDTEAWVNKDDPTDIREVDKGQLKWEERCETRQMLSDYHFEEAGERLGGVTKALESMKNELKSMKNELESMRESMLEMKKHPIKAAFKEAVGKLGLSGPAKAAGGQAKTARGDAGKKNKPQARASGGSSKKPAAKVGGLDSRKAVRPETPKTKAVETKTKNLLEKLKSNQEKATRGNAPEKQGNTKSAEI